MKRSASLIILVAGTLFASCSSLQTISFDQLQAADVSFPDAVRKVAVINKLALSLQIQMTVLQFVVALCSEYF